MPVPNSTVPSVNNPGLAVSQPNGRDLPNNEVAAQESVFPSMASFLGNNNFFGSENNADSQQDNEPMESALSTSINDFDFKLYKCRKLQLEVAYLQECIDKKIIPKGLCQWRYPMGLVEDSLFHRELLALFDRQGFEFLGALINFYKMEIGDLKAKLEILEHFIKNHNEFPRHKYEYARIFTSIEATMTKLLATKKKKIARDVHDYSNNKAYPRTPFNIPTISNVSNQSPEVNNINSPETSDNYINGDSLSGEVQTQPLRRSERLNNNNASRNDNTAFNSNQYRGLNNNNNTDVTATSNQQGFHRNPNGQQNNRQSNRKQPLP
ncbi:putative uncharacterized protein DDB_G0292438 [Protopterus annectens]|uniref:putative uncharacterized protein DDB_G0292438 n=1 Tax=Protopterus annectens TaxID=7888 RepID=UPI001CFA2BEB|nr:putative uncharacterized protein DDB_G0292438 [Protopterus annectens]